MLLNFISNSYRIGPFEVESVLIEHPAVVEAAVVSSPDELRGEIVKAFVVLANSFKNHHKKQLAKELQNYVKVHTAPYKYPRKVSQVQTSLLIKLTFVSGLIKFLKPW